MKNSIDSLTNTFSNFYAKTIDKNIRISLLNGYIFEKPKRYWYEPLFIIKIPYPYIDYETYNEDGEGGKKGLFIEWYDLKIGKKKIINKKYKEEFTKWKTQSNKTITF